MYKLCMICAFMIEAKTYDKAIARAFSYQHHAYSDLLVSFIDYSRNHLIL